MRIWNIGLNTGAQLHFHASPHTLKFIEEIQKKYPVLSQMFKFSDWDDFLIIARELKQDDNLVVVMSRKERPSYHRKMEKIPEYLDKYFKSNNFMLIYPVQDGVDEEENFETGSLSNDYHSFEDFGRVFSGLFRRR
jgi:hypothetical protein